MVTGPGRTAVLGGLLLATCLPPPLDETGKRCSEERPCGPDYLCVAGRCRPEDIDDPDAGLAPDDGGFDAGGWSEDGGTDGGDVPDGGAPADAGEPGDGGDASDGGGTLVDGGADAGEDGGVDGGVDAGLLPVEVNLLANASFENVLPDGGLRSWNQSTGTLTSAAPGRTGNRAGRLTGLPTAGPVATSNQVVGNTRFGTLLCARVWVRSEFDAGYAVTVTIRERFVDGGIEASNGRSSGALRTGNWVAVDESHISFGARAVELRVSSDVRADASVLIDDAELFVAPAMTCVYR